MVEWEQHFNKLQHGLIFDKNNPDVIENSEDENCNKKILQNDAGSSQNKSYNRHETHSLDECAQNMVKGLRAVPGHLNNDKGKTLDVQPDNDKRKTLDVQPDTRKSPHETHNTKIQGKCQSMCLCNQKYIWDSDKENMTDWESWTKCDHCKKKTMNYI